MTNRNNLLLLLINMEKLVNKELIAEISKYNNHQIIFKISH
jgi:hypothetical protein